MLWRKVVPHPLGASGRAVNEAAAALLRRQERYCVGACYRYLKRTRHDRAWYAEGAFIFHTGRVLFPVFERPPGTDFRPLLPHSLQAQMRKDGLHAAQGLAACLDSLEAPLAEQGFHPVEIIDYDLMSLDYGGTRPPAKSGPRGLILRVPDTADAGALFPLQEGYEREEVMPPGAEFYPAACLKTVEHLISGGMILAAELDGRLVGKINVNAESFTRFQVGGVYVEKAYRGRGIARAMTEEFIRRLEAPRRGLTLFVRKTNAAARAVYLKAGFVKTAGYRITYY